MARPRAWRNLAATLVVLVPVAAFVVYSSFQVSDFDFDVNTVSLSFLYTFL